ncbi:phosphonate metabolism [Psychromonas ingrahamii 37]|uniref:Phosphonate metabolism n=1 Tax=Psychromonas ingrahamii (strain DSM 17664 / CCUG 51855 / 37) TaxID=357804 RepID=A1T0V3_PSYIN|nr:phosphonate C-P lyase system protein PhnH [Psychromonas ingrahamii]ABM05368.1 phosphonate metabolism [Psychromonas ingrahamii 37]
MFKQDLLGAYINPIWLADTQQALFNSLMQVMSRPGRLDNWAESLESSPAYLAVLAILLDGEVSLADIDGLLSDDHWPLLQAQNMNAEQANYVLCDGAKAISFQPKLGTLVSPDFAATLILKVSKLEINNGDVRLKLTGPGVDGETVVCVSGLDPVWLEQRNEWCCAFPLGIDCVLVDDTQIMALPRTTKVEIIEINTNKGLN